MARRRDRPVIVEPGEADAAERLHALGYFIRLHQIGEPNGAPDLDAVEAAADGPGTAADRLAAVEQRLDLMGRRRGFETFARQHITFRHRWCPAPPGRHKAASAPERRAPVIDTSAAGPRP